MYFFSLLLPGGPGYTHDTGKLDEYCLQYPNTTAILSKLLYDERFILEVLYMEGGRVRRITNRKRFLIESISMQF